MADDKIYFDEQALSIVDSWLSGNDNESKSAKRVATSSTIAPASKVGLGFKGKVAAEKTKDALQIRLEKSQKKKKNSEPEDEPIATKVATGSTKNNSDDDNDDDDNDEEMQLHGVVEDMPISRTQKSVKPVAIVKKQQPKRKAELINGNLVCEMKETSLPIVLASIESTQKPSASSSSGTPGAENVYKRKRTKTRSKQKNIRRDNRSDSQKPSYITDTQSEDYRGRYLTEVRSLLLFLSFTFPSLSIPYLTFPSILTTYFLNGDESPAGHHLSCLHLFLSANRLFLHSSISVALFDNNFKYFSDFTDCYPQLHSLGNFIAIGKASIAVISCQILILFYFNCYC